MGNKIDLTAMRNQADREISAQPGGREYLDRQNIINAEKRRYNQLTTDEINRQDPFYRTPEQSKFLDYLNAKMYSPTVQRNEYSQMLHSRVDGESGSVAQSQLAQKLNENTAAGAEAMGANRGVMNPALLAKQTSGIVGTGSQSDVGQSALARATENQANLGMLGTEVQGSERQRLAEKQFYFDQLAQERQSNIDRTRFFSGIESENERSRNEANARESQRTSNIISGLGQGATTLGAAAIRSNQSSPKVQSLNYDPLSGPQGPSNTNSDVRLKDNIKDGNPKMQAFLDSMEPYSYNYKDSNKDDSFDHLGVMAQDVEKTPLGKTMVAEGERGKMLKPDLSTILAAAAYNNKRLKELEGKVEGRSPAGEARYIIPKEDPNKPPYTGPRLDDTEDLSKASEAIAKSRKAFSPEDKRFNPYTEQ